MHQYLIKTLLNVLGVSQLSLDCRWWGRGEKDQTCWIWICLIFCSYEKSASARRVWWSITPMFPIGKKKKKKAYSANASVYGGLGRNSCWVIKCLADRYLKCMVSLSSVGVYQTIFLYLKLTCILKWVPYQSCPRQHICSNQDVIKNRPSLWSSLPTKRFNKVKQHAMEWEKILNMAIHHHY